MRHQWKRLTVQFVGVSATAVLCGAALAQDAKNEPCAGPVKRDVEELGKRFAKLGAKGVIVGASCNARGNLAVITIHRPKDNRITRWKPRDGLTALFDHVMTGE